MSSEPPESEAPPADAAPTGRTLARVLWPALLLYGAWLSVHAWQELRATYHVEGLFRDYAPPHPIEGGWVIDARPGDLLTEIRRRYSPRMEPPDRPTRTRAEWSATLESIGLRARPAAGSGDGAHPRLLFLPDGPALRVGSYGPDPVVFVPAHGVVRFDPEAIPADTPALDLVGAREPAW